MTRSLLAKFVSSSVVVTALIVGALGSEAPAQQPKADKTFSAVVTDGQGLESDVKNIHFYWEERISETAFVPHELRHIPVKRGTSTVNVKFDSIKQIDIKPGADKGLPSMTITLANGKTGDFGLAIDGKFKGESDFGEVELPASGLRKVVFKWAVVR